MGNPIIIAFDGEKYAKEKWLLGLYPNGKYKNIVPLNNMTPRQRYELALADDEDCLIYDNIDQFLTDLQNQSISVDTYDFFSYQE